MTETASTIHAPAHQDRLGGPIIDRPTITQPRFPGATSVVEYEIEAVGAHDDQPGQTGRFSTTVPGHQGVEAALRVFHALAGTYRQGGHLNLIAWSGADRQHAVGLILAQHGWRRPGDDD